MPVRAPEDTSISMNRNDEDPQPPSSQLVNVRIAASRMGVSRWTVYHWTRTGLLESVKLGRRRLFELAVLEEFVERGKKHGQLAGGSADSRKLRAPRGGEVRGRSP